MKKLKQEDLNVKWIIMKIYNLRRCDMKICPRCGREFERLLALSRKDNKTMIYNQCGTEEALMAFKGEKNKFSDWYAAKY